MPSLLRQLPRLIKDNLHKEPGREQKDADIVEYIRLRQLWWSLHGYIGVRTVDGKRIKKYDWAQEGILSDGNSAVAEVHGVSANRVAKVRRRAESAGVLDPANVFIGDGGARLRYQMETGGKNLSMISRTSEAVHLFSFELPDGTSLTATSQRDLDEKVERHLHELSDMLKEATDDVDEAVKEALDEEREEYLADLDAKIEAEREHAKKLEAEFTEYLADLKARYGEEEPPDIIDISDEEWEEVFKKAKSARVIQAGRSLQHYMGMKTALGEYLLVELAEAVREVPHNEKFKENLRYVHERLGEVLELVIQLEEMEE